MQKSKFNILNILFLLTALLVIGLLGHAQSQSCYVTCMEKWLEGIIAKGLKPDLAIDIHKHNSDKK